MKKTLFLVIGLLVLPLALFAAERVVVVEIGTGTWCQYCPPAASSADNLAHKYPGEVLVVEYHYGDAFANQDGSNRITFYGISGYPTAVFDGIIYHVGSNTVGQYEPTFLSRKAIEPPLEISLEKTYAGYYTGSGTLTATIVNVSDKTVSGYARFVVTESRIPFEWQGEDSLHFVERDMLPGAQGELITLEPGDTLVLERNFTIDPSWPYFTSAVNVELGCFVQGSDRQIYQAALTPLVKPPSAEVTMTKVDNADGKLHPSQSANFLVTLKNTGEESWSNLSGVLRTDDPYVTIPDSLGGWGAAEPGKEVTNTEDPFTLRLKSTGQDGYRPQLTLSLEDNFGQELGVDFQVYEPVAVTEGKRGEFSLTVPAVVRKQGLIALSIPNPAHAELVLFDATGREARVLYSGTLNAGLNLVTIPVDDYAQGAYFVRASVGSRVEIKRLIIVR